jgi:hypothetical protein
MAFETLKTKWTWEEWQASRPARREISRAMSSVPIRRERSSSDRHLRRKFNGERGPAFGKSFDPDLDK